MCIEETLSNEQSNLRLTVTAFSIKCKSKTIFSDQLKNYLSRVNQKKKNHRC